MAEVQRNDGSRSGLPKSQVIGLILGAAFLLVTLILPAPGSMGAEAWAALGLMLLIATWWSTEAIPIPATALLPLVVFPILVDDVSVDDVGASYGADGSDGTALRLDPHRMTPRFRRAARPTLHQAAQRAGDQQAPPEASAAAI